MSDAVSRMGGHSLDLQMRHTSCNEAMPELVVCPCPKQFFAENHLDYFNTENNLGAVQ